MSAEDREQVGVFGPEAREHALAQDEGRVRELEVVRGVGKQGVFVGGIRGAEGGGYFCDFGVGTHVGVGIEGIGKVLVKCFGERDVEGN